MSEKLTLGLALIGLAQMAHGQADRRTRIDVEHYAIEAELNPRTQTLAAQATVRFAPVDNNINFAVFELNDALKLARVEDGSGRQLAASRGNQDHTVRVSFESPLPKGQAFTLKFVYDGRLAGIEESPVYGIRFAAIRADYSYLLYPARWFPVSDYTCDRYTMDIRLAAPAGFSIVSGGTDTRSEESGKTIYSTRFLRPQIAGSLALVKGAAARSQNTQFYLREAASAAGPYGEDIGKILAFLSTVFGLPPQSSLTVVETEKGAPNAFSTPGVLFLSPAALADGVNSRMLVNQIARQWLGGLVSPATRNHMWIINGLARYAEVLWFEQSAGPTATEPELRDIYVEALTVDQPPLIQSARLEDYAPEFWAATAGKGAAVINMLRYVIGNEQFAQLLKAIPEQFANKQINTEQLRKLTEQIHGQDLGYFFIQWIESSGAPEFKLEYTVFRTKKGFRVMGKVAQDLDTFRMPVELRIETEGNPEDKRVDVSGTSSEFTVETFGKPVKAVLDPAHKVLRFDNEIRVAVAIRRGEQLAEVNDFSEALKEYQKALDVARNSSLARYRVADVFFLQNNYQAAANEYREALAGDLEPKWVEVWSRINLGKIFDITGQRERAVNEYNLAIRTKDNTQGAQEEAARYLKEPYKRAAQTN